MRFSLAPFGFGVIIFSILPFFSGKISACGSHQNSRRQESDAAPVYAPNPRGATGQPIPPEGYITQSLGEGAYMVTDGNYQALFFVTSESVVLVDAPASSANILQDAISEVTSNPVTHLVYSHYHFDHISGAVVFAEQNPELVIVAHEETKRHIEDFPEISSKRPMPTETFGRNYTLTVDDQLLELTFEGDNHSDDNIFIWAPKQAILMFVDVIIPGYAPFFGLGLASSPAGYIRAHDQVLAYPFETFIGGHMDQPGTREDVQLQQEYLHDLFESCKDVILESADPNSSLFIQTLSGPAAEANPGNTGAVFAAYYRELASYCGSRITSRWTDRLAAVDIYEMDNALTMLGSLRNDYGILGPGDVQR